MRLEHEIRQNLKDSVSWKGKLAGASFSFGLGVGLGAIGKNTGEEYIPAIPIVMDCMTCMSSVQAYLFYGTGVAMNYIPEIYTFLQNLS